MSTFTAVLPARSAALARFSDQPQHSIHVEVFFREVAEPVKVGVTDLSEAHLSVFAAVVSRILGRGSQPRTAERVVF